MRHINGVYTQRYNRIHHCDSQLFRGRYKAIVIEEDRYLLEVLRYIHRNPIHAGLETSLGSYPWSSHPGYLSSGKKWSWLHKAFLLQFFSAKSTSQVRLYKSFVEQEEPEDIRDLYASKKLPPVVGEAAFVQHIRKAYLEKFFSYEFPEIKEIVPSETVIFSQVCDYYQIPQMSLFQSKRGQRNEARDVAIFLMSDLCYAPYQQITDTFRVNTPSAISSATERIRKRIKGDLSFFERIQKIQKRFVRKPIAHQ